MDFLSTVCFARIEEILCSSSGGFVKDAGGWSYCQSGIFGRAP